MARAQSILVNYIIVEDMVNKSNSMKQRKEKGPEFPNILQGYLAVRDNQYPNYQSIPSSSCLGAQALLLRCSSWTGHCLACLPVVCALLYNLRSRVTLERLPGQPAPGLLLRCVLCSPCFLMVSYITCRGLHTTFKLASPHRPAFTSPRFIPA